MTNARSHTQGPGPAGHRGTTRAPPLMDWRRPQGGRDLPREGATRDTTRSTITSAHPGHRATRRSPSRRWVSSAGSKAALSANAFRGRGGRYLFTGLAPCSGIRSIPPRSATMTETAEFGSARSPKMTRIGRAGTNAGRNPVRFLHCLVIDPVDAKRGFLHYRGQDPFLARHKGKPRRRARNRCIYPRQRARCRLPSACRTLRSGKR